MENKLYLTCGLKTYLWACVGSPTNYICRRHKWYGSKFIVL